MKSIFIIFPLLLLFTACGALEPKFFPEKATITSTLFPSNKEEKSNPDLEKKVAALLSGKRIDKYAVQSSGGDSVRSLFPEKGKLLIINNLAGVDTDYFAGLKKRILKVPSNISNVEVITVSSLPNLHTLRLMGARQQSQYVLILNSFSNVYVYHNAWTVPTVLGLGVPYFFLDTQTIRVFAKIEYSLIDIKENVILSNESVTAEARGTAILPESGIEQYRITNRAITEGVQRLGDKFLTRISNPR